MILIALTALFVLSACSQEKRDNDPGAQVMYEQAKEALDARRYEQAIRLYRRLTTLYPFGRHAEQAQLDLAYVQYRSNRGEDAITTLDRFIRTYPTHPNIDYAWYLKGLVHYAESLGFLRRLFPDQIIDRDQTSLRLAFNDFQELTQRYPQSRYVADARQRMVFLRNTMAEYEIAVARYYFRRGVYLGAINRAEYVLEMYPNAPAKVDALDIMTEAYSALELDELASDTRQVLELNLEGAPRPEPEAEGFFKKLWPFD
jgi:outer membrane protein assembly factor BamD